MSRAKRGLHIAVIAIVGRQQSRLTCGACKTGHPVPSQEMEVSCAPRDASEARRWLFGCIQATTVSAANHSVTGPGAVTVGHES